jgi:DNA anti-recombination protein RmuC
MLAAVERPSLPPVIAGRSALPAFLGIERWAEARVAAERGAAARDLKQARAEAEARRAEGEAALAEEVLAGEAEALREVEERARARVAEAHRALARWTQSQEDRLDALLADVLERVAGAG